jgi:hypothetical protein
VPKEVLVKALFRFPVASHVGRLTHSSARFVKRIEQAADATGT